MTKANETEWQASVKNPLKAELKRKGFSCRDPVEKLAPTGVEETERNIANKISRGGLTAVFLLQCLKVVGATSLRLVE
ncbi:DUF6471 domain-containing protein [Methylobacterium sp. WCS2018Hpa-22]|uniref:DUF6471 domain-containing protein n=1 Tax=Methylobacterium sp. WCS2018Hpa-22 TaxID=3073633 RepID=UPI00288BAAD9|nr:DUF6471 domain-containing protein [Methylobacterium sp. WCS2018Hpa-22]